MKEIFIGREKEIRLFKENFEKQFSPKKGIWDFKNKKQERETDFSKLFLLYGDGGFGKTTLTNAMSDLAEAIYKEKDEEPKIIYLDWHRLGSKDSYRKTLDTIYTEMLKPTYELSSYFTKYESSLNSLRNIQKKIEEKQKDPDTQMDIGHSAVKGIQNVVGFIPTVGDSIKKVMEIDAVANASAIAVNYAAQAGKKKLDEWVKSNGILSAEDYRLWSEQDEVLSEILVQGFQEASKKFVILLSIDTYEIVDAFDEKFRTIFLKQLLEDEQNRITVILSGRKNLSGVYKQFFTGNVLQLINLEGLLFKETQISEFATREEVPLTEAEAKEIITHTKGIPLVVKEILSDIKSQLIPKEKLFAYLRDRSSGDNDILFETVNRFIKYCDPEERKKVFTLSILKEWDSELLQKLWGKEVNIELALNTLAERHSFINLGKSGKNKTFNEYLRKYLISELDESKSSLIRGMICEFGRQISIHWEEKLKAYETKEPALDDRYNDKNYITFLKNYLNAVAFHDLHKLFTVLPGIILESMQFNLELCKEISNALNEFTPPMTDKQKAKLKIMQEGIGKFQFINAENEKGKSPEEVLRLIEYFESNRSILNEIQKTILEFRHGEIIFKSGELELAFEHFEKYGNILSSLGRIKEYLADILFNIGRASKNAEFMIKSYSYCIEFNPKKSEAFYWRAFGYRKLKEYQKAIEDYSKAINLDPSYAMAWALRGSIYYFLKEYQKAIEDHSEAIELNPKNPIRFFWFRGNLYDSLKDYPKAIEDYSKAIELDPKDFYTWMAYNSRANTYLKLEKYPEAIDDYSKIIEHKPDAETYTKRGWTYNKLNDYTKANEDYCKAIELDPNEPLVQLNFSQFLFILNRDKEAIDYLNKAFSLNPARPSILSELWFYSYAHISEKREEAKGKLKELIEENIRKNGADSLLDDYGDFSLNIEKAIREGHPEPELLKEFAKKITGREFS